MNFNTNNEKLYFLYIVILIIEEICSHLINLLPKINKDKIVFLSLKKV